VLTHSSTPSRRRRNRRATSNSPSSCATNPRRRHQPPAQIRCGRCRGIVRPCVERSQVSGCGRRVRHALARVGREGQHDLSGRARDRWIDVIKRPIGLSPGVRRGCPAGKGLVRTVRIRGARIRGVHQARLQTQIEQEMMADNRTLLTSRSQDTVHEFTQKTPRPTQKMGSSTGHARRQHAVRNAIIGGPTIKLRMGRSLAFRWKHRS
jgi:hypothetical protein